MQYEAVRNAFNYFNAKMKADVTTMKNKHKESYFFNFFSWISKKLSMVEVRELSEGERVAKNICVLLGYPMLKLESKLEAASLQHLKSSKTFEQVLWRKMKIWPSKKNVEERKASCQQRC